jgi:hypothetical protein
MTGVNILRILAVFIILICLGLGVYFTIIKDQIGYFLGSILLIGIILIFTTAIWNDDNNA